MHLLCNNFLLWRYCSYLISVLQKQITWGSPRQLMLLRLSLHFSLKLRSYRRFHYLWKNAKGGIWTHNPLWKCFTTCAKIVFSPFIPLKRHELFIQVVNPISFFSQMKLFSNFHFNAIPLFRLFSQMKIYWAFKFLKWNKNMIKKHSL